MARDEAEKSPSFEERLFDFVFKDVPMNRIYVRKWCTPHRTFDNSQCDVCIENGLGVPNDLYVYCSILNENSYIKVPWSRSWKFKASTRQGFHRDVFLKDFYGHCIDDVKHSIGNAVLDLIKMYTMKEKAKWLEIRQHLFASDKPLFRCTSLEQLLIEMDLHGGNADED